MVLLKTHPIFNFNVLRKTWHIFNPTMPLIRKKIIFHVHKYWCPASDVTSTLNYLICEQSWGFESRLISIQLSFYVSSSHSWVKLQGLPWINPGSRGCGTGVAVLVIRLHILTEGNDTRTPWVLKINVYLVQVKRWTLLIYRGKLARELGIPTTPISFITGNE